MSTKFQIKITNESSKFQVDVYDGKKKIYTSGWKGGEFQYKNKWYGIFGPYHSLDGDKFRVYELVPVSDIT